MPDSPAMPLSRFTVLDLTRVRAGPTAVRQLADWGAKVIKLEAAPAPGSGESMGGPRHGPDFQNLHRNKRSLTLDLKAPEGIEIFRKLVQRADVLVENYRPDVKTRLGIDYAALEPLNPRLVYASISGFGQTGPYRDRPGFDQIAQGMGGLMSITGLPGQGPVRVGIPIGVFKTRDGHINIASAGDEIFGRLCRALDRPELADHPAYRTAAARSQNRQDLNAAIEAITSERDS